MHLPDVPVSDAVELDVAHVRARQNRDDRTILLDLSLEVVTAFSDSDSVICGYTVRLIKELTSAGNAVHKRAPEGIMELVLVGCICDLPAVFESDGLATFHVEVDRVHMNA